MRILEPMYECTLQCDQGQLGNLYSVLSKRRGTVVKDDIIEGTSLFVLTVSIPITESFGLSQVLQCRAHRSFMLSSFLNTFFLNVKQELLKRTSGSATTPLLVFSHWQLIDFDPFWRPTTEDELEEFGDNASLTNPTRMLIDKVRRRKGLPVEEKIIEFAEKQRTLNKKK